MRPPSYTGLYAAIMNAPVDALAELHALVPGAILPLSNLIRTMIATVDHGGGAAALGPSAASPPPGSTHAPADGRARTHFAGPLRLVASIMIAGVKRPRRKR